MQLTVNGQVIDITLENEKNIGEVLTALEQWLTDSGHRIAGLGIDGQKISASMLETVFSKEINSVKALDIHTDVLADLTISSLVTLLDDIKEYESMSFEDKTKFFDNWNESACSRFIDSEIKDLYTLCVNTFLHGDITPFTLYSITEERIREVKEPLNELINLESILDEVCEKLVNLPLDIQTGKDLIAAQTIQIFSAVTEKIIRIYYQLDIQGYFNTEQTQNKTKIVQYISEFTNVLKELLDAYERNDSVLVGDLAEYEASPKVKELYTAILNNCRSEK
jgi:hypothetical protein